MTVAFSKPVDLILDAGAISRAHTSYPAGEHRAFVEPGLKRIVHLLIGVSNPATFLFCGFCGIEKRKASDFRVAFLLFHFGIVQASSINTGRSAGLQSICFKAKTNQLFRQARGRLLSHSAATKILFPYVYDSVQESPVG